MNRILMGLLMLFLLHGATQAASLDAQSQPLEGTEPSPYTAFPLTIECSVKIDSKDGFNILLASHPKTSDEHWELYTESRTGNFAVYCPRYETPVLASASPVADGEWRHLAAILEDSRVRLYVDGDKVLDKEVQTKKNLRPGSGPFTVGYTYDGAAKIFCEGQIDEVRISEGVRDIGPSHQEPLEDDDHTIGLWHFENRIGDRFVDASKTGYNLEILVKKRKIQRLGSEVVDIDDQDEEDWKDDRWPLMDTGPFFSATITTPQIPDSRPTYKGIAVKLGENEDRSILFDTELLRVSCGWEGDFIKTFPKRLGIIDLPQVASEILFKTDPVPGASTDSDFIDPRDSEFGPMPKEYGRYQGLYEHGDRIAFAYTLGETEVLESPWVEEHGDLLAISRTLQLESVTDPIHLLLAHGENPETREIEGSKIAIFNGDESVSAFGLVGEAGSLVVAEDRMVAKIDPSEGVVRLKVLAWTGDESELPNFARLLQESAPPEDLKQLTQGGPSHWNEPIEVKGIISQSEDPYVIDTIPVPHENPHNALMYTSGLDFLPNGDLAVCTVHGDVWLVKGIDEELERVIWRRFATGLFQPLGLKVREGEIFVLGRDRITRLHDLNGDDEADFYESFNGDIEIAGGGHSYATCLDTDSKGNFYFSKGADSPRTAHDGSVLKVSADGSQLSVLATGFRYPNGMSVLEEDLVSIADQEGTWVPASRIDFAGPGFFSGYMDTHHRETPPETYDHPMCWLPQDIDNSCGGQVKGEGDEWGPLSKELIHLSYGHCMMMYCLTEQVEDQWQGGVVRLPLQFLSGVMRGRFGPDGQLYLCGIRGWQTSAVRDGCLQRVRYTGAPFYDPIDLSVHENGIRIVFNEPLDEEFATDPESYAIEQWNYLWRKEYGSEDWSAKNPDQLGHDEMEVDKIHLLEDGKTVFIEIPDLTPAMQTQIRYNLDAEDGELVKGVLHHTIHQLGEAYSF